MMCCVCNGIGWQPPYPNQEITEIKELFKKKLDEVKK